MCMFRSEIVAMHVCNNVLDRSDEKCKCGLAPHRDRLQLAGACNAAQMTSPQSLAATCGSFGGTWGQTIKIHLIFL
jgi:hypothetical protein